jgi:hypothetical protein
MRVERDAVEFTGAEPRIYRTCGDSGHEKHCAFCGQCGTRLYHAGGGVRSEGSTILSMKAGTLDDTSVVAPTSHLWTRRAQPWMAPILEREICFVTEPSSEDTLRAQRRDAQGDQSGQSA